MIGPASTIPSPPPIPRIAEIRAIPCATRARGNSSRMIPKARGKIAPPAPWMTRARIITVMLLASAASSVPQASTSNVATSVCSLPNMSPSRPTIGVSTEALRRYAVSTQAPSVADACSSR